MTIIIVVFAVKQIFCLNYWNWDCESTNLPEIKYLNSNTTLVTDRPHSGDRCMQIRVAGTGGNQSAGANVSDIDNIEITTGKWYYYRWWMKLDQNFSWGAGSAKTKASRMKHMDEVVKPRLWTGYVSDDGVCLAEADDLPESWTTNGVKVQYDMKRIAGTGWHEYIVAMKMQNGYSDSTGEFHFYVDGKLIGMRKNIFFTSYRGVCSEAWRGWMVCPYFQLNGTENDGGLMWLDDYSMDDQWNSLSFPQPIFKTSTFIPDRKNEFSNNFFVKKLGMNQYIITSIQKNNIQEWNLFDLNGCIIRNISSNMVNTSPGKYILQFSSKSSLETGIKNTILVNLH